MDALRQDFSVAVRALRSRSLLTLEAPTDPNVRVLPWNRGRRAMRRHVTRAALIVAVVGTGWPPSPESARPRRASGVPKASAGGPSRSHETELTGPRTAALKRWRPTQPRDAGLEEAPSGRRRNGRDRRSRPETSPASRRTRPTTRGASTRRRVRVARRSSFHRPGRPPCLNGDHDRPRATVRSGRCSRLDGDSGRRTRATISRPVSRTPSSGTSRSLGRVFERAVAWGKRLRPSSHVTSLIR